MIATEDKKQMLLEAKTFLRKAVFITGSIQKLSVLTNISYSTLSRIARGRHKGNRATRFRLHEFILQNQRVKPISDKVFWNSNN